MWPENYSLATPHHIPLGMDEDIVAQKNQYEVQYSGNLACFIPKFRDYQIKRMNRQGRRISLGAETAREQKMCGVPNPCVKVFGGGRWGTARLIKCLELFRGFVNPYRDIVAQKIRGGLQQ